MHQLLGFFLFCTVFDLILFALLKFFFFIFSFFSICCHLYCFLFLYPGFDSHFSGICSFGLCNLMKMLPFQHNDSFLSWLPVPFPCEVVCIPSTTSRLSWELNTQLFISSPLLSWGSFGPTSGVLTTVSEAQQHGRAFGGSSSRSVVSWLCYGHCHSAVRWCKQWTTFPTYYKIPLVRSRGKAYFLIAR